MIKGGDVRIHKTAVIKRPDIVAIGSHVAIDPFFYMTTGAKIGDWVHISSHVSVIGGEDATLNIGNYVAISTGCRLICRSNDFSSIKPAIPFGDIKQKLGGSFIKIGDNVILGANVVVFPDVTIGGGVAVGSNSLVTKSITVPGIYAGIPVKRIGDRK